MAEGSAVWVAEQELRLAQLQEEYHAVLDQTHEAPEDEGARARKGELADEIVAVRSELRRQREAETLTLTEGEGVARPAPVNSESGVSE